jgi:hypothetical protein
MKKECTHNKKKIEAREVSKDTLFVELKCKDCNGIYFGCLKKVN